MSKEDQLSSSENKENRENDNEDSCDWLQRYSDLIRSFIDKSVNQLLHQITTQQNLNDSSSSFDFLDKLLRKELNPKHPESSQLANLLGSTDNDETVLKELNEPT